ncbi:hypothetical protein Plhal304r1_c091g0171821 [Plasmopara halstedii]
MMCPALPDRFRLDVTRLSHSIGAFYRHSFDANGTTLAVGTLTKQPFLSKDSNTTLVLTLISMIMLRSYVVFNQFKKP